MDLIAHLAHLPLFEGLPEDQLDAVAAIARERVLGRGELVFSEGDEGAGFYVVARGRIKIFKLSPEGKEQILHIFGPGEPFGEVAMFAGRHFPAYAEAIEPARVLFFPRLSLGGLIAQNPGLALNMLGLLSMRLRRFTNLIEDLSLKEVPGRLAAYLIILSQKNDGAAGFDLDVTKAQLASLLGTIPETLSRILARMNQGEIIRVDGRRIVILDRQALEELSQAERRLA